MSRRYHKLHHISSNYKIECFYDTNLFVALILSFLAKKIKQ
jgi:hypothetical protein